ncbi:hypothetical protein GCM10009557_17870 [Virgisporangium ochraceum]|uniref:Phosphoenolpyruvate phosphomutase n=1 Tax=Virgisporangium ochraceum TaxID=65505 RepID=A0A8J4EFD0_9ACTN|nr:isocitrate lyase/phosphoenolpyruvate mutase family protein [Virgisporangium ochraceum]GIJ72684.1 hypothetical protein Voc01_076010 [Virgisporangium ochraceum]
MLTFTGSETPATRLRTALNAPTGSPPVRAVGTSSVLAASVAMEAGFDALWVSGLEVSASRGLPDANVLGSRDLADVVLALTGFCDLPVVVDVDNAGGSTLTARRYANELARAGAAALCLEDSAYPKCNSFSGHREQRIADLELVCAQLMEMRSVVGPETMIIGRTESLIVQLDLSVALDRAARMVDAGADAVLIHSKDPAGREALQVAARWDHRVPLVTVPTAFPHMSWHMLGDAGYRLCIYANQLSRAAISGMRRVAERFVETGVFDDGERLASVQDVLRCGEPEATASL